MEWKLLRAEISFVQCYLFLKHCLAHIRFLKNICWMNEISLKIFNSASIYFFKWSCVCYHIFKSKWLSISMFWLPYLELSHHSRVPKGIWTPCLHPPSCLQFLGLWKGVHLKAHRQSWMCPRRVFSTSALLRFGADNSLLWGLSCALQVLPNVCWWVESTPGDSTR